MKYSASVWIKSAALKPSKETGRPLMQIVMDCGVTNEHDMYSMIKVWSENHSRVTLTFEYIIDPVEIKGMRRCNI